MFGGHHHHHGHPGMGGMGGMGGFGGYAPNQEMMSDMWIQQNVPGGLNSPLGQRLDNYLGGNPNPTFGQMHGGFGGYGGGYGYQYGGW